jgi:hypothetical protein
MAVIHSKWAKMYQHLPSQGPPKCSKIFGLKIKHQATLTLTLTLMPITFPCTCSKYIVYKWGTVSQIALYVEKDKSLLEMIKNLKKVSIFDT